MCHHYHPLSVDSPHDPPRNEPANLAFTRRRFLGAGLGLVSTLGTVPGFLANTARAASDSDERTSSKPGVPQERVLVVIQLSGGNDGLNTLVPFADREYHRARPGLAVPPRDVLRLGDTGFGLHPELRPFLELLEDRRAAVVHGVGYPNPNRSHFASMAVWHTADPQAHDQGGGARGNGWIGKALDATRDNDAEPKPLDCVTLGSEAPLAARGERVQPIAFDRPELFRWRPGAIHEDLEKAYDRFHDMDPPVEGAGLDDPLNFIHRTACDAQLASAKIRKAVESRPKTDFPRGPLADQLRSVAAMIRAELPTRVYYANLGGFDTHAGQQNRHANLLARFAEGVKAFYDELEATGHQDRVVTLAFSEFGRRVAQNASAGTDHGAAGPVFLAGPAVRPGLLGNAPSLTELDNGDLKYTLDFRHLYAGLLQDWLKINPRPALGQNFRPARIITPS